VVLDHNTVIFQNEKGGGGTYKNHWYAKLQPKDKESKVFYLNSQRNKNFSGSFQPDKEKACNICPFQKQGFI
jgi:hypothetical protein